jgi:hypothetical protein
MPALPIFAASQPGWLRKAQFVSKSDAKFLYDEIHVKRSYEQMGVRLGDAGGGGGGGTVLDIGANVGMFTTRAAEAIGSLEVTHILQTFLSLLLSFSSKIQNNALLKFIFFSLSAGCSCHRCRASSSDLPRPSNQHPTPQNMVRYQQHPVCICNTTSSRHR